MSNDNVTGIIGLFIIATVGFAIYHIYLGVKAAVNYIGSILNHIVDIVARFFMPF